MLRTLHVVAGAGLSGVVLAALAVGCENGAAPDIAVHSATRPAAGPCTADGAGSGFDVEVASLKVTATADDMPAPVSALGSVGPLQVAEVPAGENRSVGVFGLNGESAVWRGVAQRVSVKANEDTAIDVLMTRLGDLTCARGTDSDKRAFHTATTLDDGKILVVGGAREGSDASATCGLGCHRLVGSPSASLYDPQTGTYTPVGGLTQARLFHTAAKLGDGRVVIAGGASSALVHAVDTQFPFPIEPVGAVAAIEVFDPSSLTFQSAGSDPNGARVFAAASATDEGDVLITGGVAGPGATRNDLSNALDSSTVCRADLSCGNGPVLQSHRAGHAAFLIPGDGVFLWGGSVDLDNTNGTPRFQLENLQGGTSTLLNVAAMNNFRNVFFGATAQYLPFRVLMAGGLNRSADGTFTPALADADGTTGGAVYVYSETDGGPQGGIANGKPPNDVAMHLKGPLIFASAAPLPGGSRAVIAGGFEDLSFKPSSDLELFDQATLIVSPLSVGGAPRTLRDARGGLVAATNDDGTVVFTGGEAPLAANRAPLATAEIFADPLTPPGVAE